MNTNEPTNNIDGAQILGAIQKMEERLDDRITQVEERLETKISTAIKDAVSSSEERLESKIGQVEQRLEGKILASEERIMGSIQGMRDENAFRDLQTQRNTAWIHELAENTDTELSTAI